MRNAFLKIIGGVAFAGSLIATAMMFGSSGNAKADAQSGICGAHTLRGSYVFNAHGWNIVGGVAVPKAILEGIDFNGDGTLVSPFATVSINGNILHFGIGGGSYTVDPDCTGTIAFAGGITYDIFVDPRGGRQLWMIQTGGALPAVFEGAAVRVSP